MNKFFEDYKTDFSNQVKSEFKNVELRWNGDNPNLIFPDGAGSDLKDKAIAFVELLYLVNDGEVVFHRELECKIDE
ncbi:MAG: hypothetical protein WA061_02535 [Microgenomates group bacterium]